MFTVLGRASEKLSRLILSFEAQTSRRDVGMLEKAHFRLFIWARLNIIGTHLWNVLEAMAVASFIGHRTTEVSLETVFRLIFPEVPHRFTRAERHKTLTLDFEPKGRASSRVVLLVCKGDFEDFDSFRDCEPDAILGEVKPLATPLFVQESVILGAVDEALVFD